MINEEEKDIMREIANNIESQAMNYHNFDSLQNFDSIQNMDGESVLNMGEYGQRQFMPKQMTPHGLSSYALRIFYTDNFGSGTPVLVELFQPYFNTGTFVGDDLVFTNAAGETATIQGITEIYRAFHNRSETQSFKISYIRMNVVDTAQFGNRWRFQKRSVWGADGGNNLIPDEFLTPEQFQLLRVDVPANYNVNGERGIELNINATELEVSGGTRMTLYIDKLMDPFRKMQGKSEVVNMRSPAGLMQTGPTRSLQSQIESLQTNALLQDKLKRLRG